MSNLTTTQQTIMEAAAGRADGSIHPLPKHITGGVAKNVIKALRNAGLIDDSDCITALGHNAVDPDWTAPEQVNDVATELDIEADDEGQGMEHEEENDADIEGTGDFENDVNAAEQSFAESNEKVPEVIEAIAKRYVQEHGFRVIVENLEKALIEAFKAGQTSNAPKTKTPRENSKKAIVMALLQRSEGASLQQIEQATGWGSNTVRGFLSLAKKKQGLNLETFRTRMVGANQQGTKGSYTVYKVV